MQRYVILLTLLFFFVVFPQGIHALENPLDQPNNRFGIHVIDENDFSNASNLVNSSGGEWGYITFVIREDERDIARWNRAFSRLSSLKLIPIVRLATTNQNGIWQIPDPNEAIPWARFLSALNWPVENRYIILFNEPNHAKEWGGILDPEGYTRIARIYWQELKKASPDFFVLPAALDAAAGNTTATMEQSLFFKKMYQEDDYIFTIFDGLTSHSYPNPGFCASPDATGKSSVRGFEWELSYLESLDLFPDMPVFITETGWACNQVNLSDNYSKAFSQAWSHPRIAAVTPFILNYTTPPFNKFSWINPQTSEFYPHYQTIMELPKTKGEPTLTLSSYSTAISQASAKYSLSN